MHTVHLPGHIKYVPIKSARPREAPLPEIPAGLKPKYNIMPIRVETVDIPIGS